MDDLKEIITGTELGSQSIPAIEINNYKKSWNRDIFIAKERGGIKRKNFFKFKSGWFLEKQLFLAAGLMEFGIEKGDFIAIFSPNSVRYAIAIYSILSIGAVYVPVYPTLTVEDVERLLRHSGTRFAFAGDVPQYQKLFSILNKVKSPLRSLIVNCEIESRERNVLTFDELITMGEKSGRVKEVLARAKELSEEDLAALFYTPGTTGLPKAAMLTHGNFLSQKGLADEIKISQDDIKLAHLPFSHVFGLTADLFASALTGSVTAISSSFQTEDILHDLYLVKPTMLFSVPRMYEKIYVFIMQRINQMGFARRAIYSFAIKIGKACYIRKCNGKRIPFFMGILNLVFSMIYRRVRASLKFNNIRLFFSGSGPLPVEVSYFFGAMGVPIIEGYGLTETSPVINMNMPDKNKPGTVGPPVDGVEEMISDEGEILVKGPMVFRGYYNVPDDIQNEAFTEDGFFRTGDTGRFDEDGYLIITGRIKELIITSNGKNIVPLVIEKKFQDEKMINCICIVGDRRKYITALVVPNFSILINYAREHNINFSGREDIVMNTEIVEIYKRIINAVSDTLARYEQIKKFTLLPNEFTVETGEITTTDKFKRAFIQKKYKDIIDMMYPGSDMII